MEGFAVRSSSIVRRNSRVAIVAALAFVAGAGLVPAPTAIPVLSLLSPAAAVAAEEGFEDARTSKMLGFALPGTAQRMVHKENQVKLAEGLIVVGGRNDMEVTRGAWEVLGWGVKDAGNEDSEAIRSKVIAAIKKAGYRYETVSDAQAEKSTPMRFFKAVGPGGKTLLGYWIVQPGDGLLMTWGKVTALGAAAEAADAPAAPANTPGDLVGEWRKTEISATTYTNSYNGAYAGSGNQGSMTYEFLPNGRYKLYSYIKTRAYSMVTESYTWEDGTVTVAGDRLVLRPTSGKFKVSGTAESHNYTRPYTAKEIRDRVKGVQWSRNGDALTLGSVTYQKVR